MLPRGFRSFVCANITKRFNGRRLRSVYCLRDQTRANWSERENEREKSRGGGERTRCTDSGSGKLPRALPEATSFNSINFDSVKMLSVCRWNLFRRPLIAYFECDWCRRRRIKFDAGCSLWWRTGNNNERRTGTVNKTIKTREFVWYAVNYPLNTFHALSPLDQKAHHSFWSVFLCASASSFRFQFAKRAAHASRKSNEMMPESERAHQD